MLQPEKWRGTMRAGKTLRHGRMSDQSDDHGAMLSQTAQRVFADLQNADFAQSAHAVAQAGLSSVMVDAERGGFGGGWEDAQRIFFASGETALAYPIAEAIVAAALVSQSEHSPETSLTLAQRCNGGAKVQGGAIQFTGTLKGVAGEADHIAALVNAGGKTYAAIIPRSGAKHLDHRSNPAGEVRDELTFENVSVPAVPSAWDRDKLFRSMALARASQMAGAMSAALTMSIQYTRERQQFGKPLASFQAIQQQLAAMAEEAAAARAVSAAAARAADRGDGAFEIACAKLRANMAAGQGASIAHQVHGAIGFTKEYALQKFTRRLWAWRSEYGNERHWASQIGALAVARGPDGFWPALVSGFAA
jgi:acyl-CoA dehydrogenase